MSEGSKLEIIADSVDAVLFVPSYAARVVGTAARIVAAASLEVGAETYSRLVTRPILGLAGVEPTYSRTRK